MFLIIFFPVVNFEQPYYSMVRWLEETSTILTKEHIFQIPYIAVSLGDQSAH
jgi:hypothetical protein